MQTAVELDFHLESAHRLPMLPADHKCARLHGHSFRVTLRVEGPLDPRFGWVVDYAVLAAAFAPLHERLDHRLLNEVPGLDNPTSENLARYIANHLVLPLPARLTAVLVHETCTSRCELRL